MSVPRSVSKVFLAAEQSEGAGARVRRSVGTAQLRSFSPFLMLDHFEVDVGAGFPDHPHRGQETITYLLSGGMDHEDFAGNSGTLGPGDLQFMTAGRGIVHAEMPAQRPGPNASPNVGLQLWVDLPRDLKMCEPRYRDLRAAEVPAAGSADGLVSVRVISGRSYGVDSVRDLAYTPVWLLDLTVRPGGTVDQALPLGWNAFAYILEGAAWFGGGGGDGGNDGGGGRRRAEQYHNVVFAPEGDLVRIEVDRDAAGPARLVLIAGSPLDQPVVQHGPFVLNSAGQVRQAIIDYQTCSNGFERARGWESEIGKSMAR